MADPPRIFVAIAAYRDPEVRRTLVDLAGTAARPDLLSVGLCVQALPEDVPVETPRAMVVRRADVDARAAQGACWAKRRALDLRAGEPLVLLIDSHMRFHPGWDLGMREMLGACASPRPLLSAYPAPFVPPKAGFCQTPRMLADHFDAEGVLVLGAVDVPKKLPEPGAFLAGGYIFSSARLWDEVPYDPHLYFQGEEITLSARAYTHGWDVYHPPVCVLHHEYDRVSAPRHWSDHEAWVARQRRSAARVRHLLGTERSTAPEVAIGLGSTYGLGTARTLAAYQAWAGINFQAQTIDPRGRRGPFTGPRPV